MSYPLDDESEKLGQRDPASLILSFTRIAASILSKTFDEVVGATPWEVMDVGLGAAGGL